MNLGLIFFYGGAKKYSYTLHLMESNYKKCANAETILMGGNRQMFYYNYNFCMFTKMFTNSKLFKHLIKCVFSEITPDF